MELYNVKDMSLSNDPEIRSIQEKQLQGLNLSITDKMILMKKSYGRDNTINKIGEYICKPDHCYRCVSPDTLERYRKCGYIKDERREDFIEGVNNQGIDWYLGGTMPCKTYGYIIIECPADKEYFVPANDNGLKMSNDVNVRHMKSSPQKNPVPMNMVTNIFDYTKILEQQRVHLEELRKESEMLKQQLNAQISDLEQNVTFEETGHKL